MQQTMFAYKISKNSRPPYLCIANGDQFVPVQLPDYTTQTTRTYVYALAPYDGRVTALVDLHAEDSRLIHDHRRAVELETRMLGLIAEFCLGDGVIVRETPPNDQYRGRGLRLQLTDTVQPGTVYWTKRSNPDNAIHCFERDLIEYEKFLTKELNYAT